MIGAAFIWSKHNRVGSFITELRESHASFLGEQLQIGSTTLLSSLEGNVVLDDERLRVEMEGAIERSRNSGVLRLGFENKTQVTLQSIFDETFNCPLACQII